MTTEGPLFILINDDDIRLASDEVQVFFIRFHIRRRESD